MPPKQNQAGLQAFELTTHECDGHIIAALHGDVDTVSAPGAAAALWALADRPAHFILDLADLAFLDCRGLSVLLVARVEARKAGGDLALAAPQDHVRRLLTLTGKIDVVTIYDSALEGTLPPVAA